MSGVGYQVLVARFVCSFPQCRCLQSVVLSRRVERRRQDSRAHRGPGAEPRGSRGWQQVTPARRPLRFPEAWEDGACFRETRDGRVLHVCLFISGWKGRPSGVGVRLGVCLCVCPSVREAWCLFCQYVCIFKLSCFLLFIKCRRPLRNKFFVRSRS